MRTDLFHATQLHQRIGKLKRRFLHVLVDFYGKILEAFGRRGHDAEKRSESLFQDRVRSVGQHSGQILARILRVVLFHVNADHEILACGYKHRKTHTHIIAVSIDWLKRKKTLSTTTSRAVPLRRPISVKFFSTILSGKFIFVKKQTFL